MGDIVLMAECKDDMKELVKISETFGRGLNIGTVQENVRRWSSAVDRNVNGSWETMF